MNWSSAGSSPILAVPPAIVTAAEAHASSSLATTSGGAPTC